MRELLTRGKFLRGAGFLILVVVLVGADVRNAQKTAAFRGKFTPMSTFEAMPASPQARVAIARSDDPALADPSPLDVELSYAQVEALTRHAVELAGGLESVVSPGDRVLIKPNIVDPEPPGVGEITDVRVVKAVALLVHEAAGGEVEIVVGEGSPRPMDYELQFAPSWSSPAWKKLWDVAGFQDLLTDPDLQGVNLRLANLNGPRDELVQVEIPGGGYASTNAGMLWVHREVLEADVHITVPVMKVHNTGITVGLKNNIGLYPSTKYGFSKGSGVPQDDNRVRLIHYGDMPRDWVEEEIVDMALVADVDFVVVDAVMCLERSKGAKRSGGKITNQVRRNMILAGSDIVAVDHVAARLMEQNPDDVAHVTLAALAGLGQNQADLIEVVGSSVELSCLPFVKDPYFTSDFGQSNRTWLFRGPFDASTVEEPMAHAFIAEHERPQRSLGGWSTGTYFFDDRIDLASYFGVGVGSEQVAYAFSYFDAPQQQSAELWLGSDEAMRVYLNDELVYDYDRRRRYSDEQLVAEKVAVQLQAGENALLVKVFQELGDFDFALNICEPEANPELDGDRVAGLRFRTGAPTPTAVGEQAIGGLPAEFALQQNYPNPFNANTVIDYLLPGDVAGRSIRLDIFDLAGQRIRTLAQRGARAGWHHKVWDGRDESGAEVASGLYMYRLQVGDRVEARKMMLMR